jgi:DNA-binding GntR family transcriptional regulator
VTGEPERPLWRSRIRLVDEVAEELRQRIYTRRHPPGSKLRQEQLAAELGVSRTPLKEALRVLEAEGLVTVSPRGGVQVKSPTVSTLLAAYELREVVDGLAARLAARSRGAATDVDGFLAEQEACLRDWDGAVWTLSNVAFHGAILEASDNEYVAGQMSLLRLTAQVFVPVARLGPTRAAGALREHAAIAEAIREGDAEQAERLARAHIRVTIEAISSGAMELDGLQDPLGSRPPGRGPGP